MYPDRMNLSQYLINHDLASAAYSWAAAAHGDQKRWFTGESYFQHCCRVAETVVRLNLDEECVAAALLHDSVEDTDTTLDMIQEEFGDKVHSLVKAVTTVKGDPYWLSIEKVRSAGTEAVLIKRSDMLDNIATIPPGHALLDKYLNSLPILCHGLRGTIKGDVR